MKGISISMRLALWYGGISMVGLAILGIALWFVLEHSMLSWKDRTLQMRAAHVEALLAARLPPADPQARSVRLKDLVSVLPEGELVQIVGTDGARLFPLDRSSSDPTVFPAACPGSSLQDVVLGKEYFRVLCHPVMYGNRQAFLLVPSPLAEDRLLLRNFTFGLYKSVPLILLVAGIAGYTLSRRALVPVDVLIAEARTITAKDLTRRLTVSAPDDQLRRLAMEWNGLLARIESALQRTTQFTADASHELRNPIAYIRATAEYSLGSKTLDPESREAFRSIVEETRMTSGLLENLLMLARLDNATLPEGVDEISVCEAVTEVALQFGPAVRSKSQTLLFNAPAQPDSCLWMNPLHFRRVLTAVLDNAIKYTPEQGKVTVSYDLHDGLRLHVADTGIGIAPQHIDRIFDRFYRVDEVRSELADGVGLGLPIAKCLMDMYGAEIRVESHLDHGTTVTLAFPQRLLTQTSYADTVHA